MLQRIRIGTSKLSIEDAVQKQQRDDAVRRPAFPLSPSSLV